MRNLPVPVCLQIAQACGASSPHLYKVLRVLAHHEMMDELPGKRFTPNDATRELVQVGELVVHHHCELFNLDHIRHLCPGSSCLLATCTMWQTCGNCHSSQTEVCCITPRLSDVCLRLLASCRTLRRLALVTWPTTLSTCQSGTHGSTCHR